jgi:SAM-dependent methyltransferase
MDVQNLQFPDSSFDLIVSSENFEHLPDQKAHVAELARVLRHGGLCIVASPNPEMTIGVHNRFHTKENTYAELLDLFSKYFGEVSIIENSLEPPTSTGRDQRTERWLKGQKGSMVPPGVDTTWLHNTHSFFCFLLQPLKQ